MERHGGHLDPIDVAIVEALQRDGRLPFTRLGQVVGLSEGAARQRVQRLVEAGLMQVVAVTNPMAHGKRRMGMIGIRADGPTDRIAELLQADPAIEYLVVTAGGFDLMAEVVVDDDAALLALTNRIRAVPGVRSTESFIYLDLVKQTFAWGVH